MTLPHDSIESSAPREADFAARVAAHLDQRVSSLAEAATRARSRADDDAIHDFRVSARRLAALLSLWRSFLRDRPRRRATRRMRDLRRALGNAREAEVNLVQLGERVAQEPLPTRLAAADLLMRLRAEVDRGRRATARRASRRRMNALVRRLGDAREPLVPRARAMSDPSAPARLKLERYIARAQHAIAEARAIGSDEAFHAARIAIKRWRYAAEGLAEAGCDAGDTPERMLRRAQQLLGEAHDRAGLRDLVSSEMARLREAGLDPQADALRTLVFDFEGERRQAIERFEREIAPELAAPRAGT